MESIPEEVPFQLVLLVADLGPEVVAVVARELRAVHTVVVVVLVVAVFVDLIHLLLVLPCDINQSSDIICPVNINEAELLEVNIARLIIVERVVNPPVIAIRHGDAAELKALDELLELQLTVVVYIEASEGSSVVFEFLLKSLMDNSEELLEAGFVRQALFRELVIPVDRRSLPSLFTSRILHITAVF